MDLVALLPVVIVIAVSTLFLIAFVYASRVKKVGPNQVLIISGRGERYRIVTGGRSFVWPILERVDDLSLEIMTIDVTTPDVPSLQGVPVTVDGIAQVKIASDENSIRTAAIQFLSKSTDQIRYVAHETLAGHLRAILGTLTVEELYRDRDRFAQEVQSTSGTDMVAMGMEIVSFVIKDISDQDGYLEALGRPRIAEVKRDAEIAEAESARDATIRSAKARQEGESAKFDAETKIAESRKAFEVERAVYQAQINKKQAEAELARPLQENIENQKVRAEAVQIEVVEKQKQIEVQQQEALRKERELEATVRKPAEAEQYRIRTLADARNYQLRTEAEGEAEAIRLHGVGEAESARARGLADAEVVRQKGLAEAEATLKKAGAWKEYTQAAVVQQLIDALPKLAEAVSLPLAQTERIVIIGGGENGSGSGASKITQDVTNIIAQLPPAVEALTGINLMDVIQNLPGLQDAPAQKASTDGRKTSKRAGKQEEELDIKILDSA